MAFTMAGGPIAREPELRIMIRLPSQPTAPDQPLADHRFTIDGSEQLETSIRETCRDAAHQLRALIPARRLQGLLLAGGYGRGEGGVHRTPAGEKPYNDLEFFLLVKGHPWINERRYRDGVHRIETSLSRQIGIEVEFKITSAEAIRRSPTSMFFYDLVMGHRRILGDSSLTRGWDHHRRADHIPLHEATRLLMNRCSGLLFSMNRLAMEEFQEPDNDFVQRNIAKLRLALGDVMLCRLGQYHWSCLERNQRLQSLDEGIVPFPLEQIRACHNRGIDFKLWPSVEPRSRSSLTRELTRLLPLAWQVWRWLEEARLDRKFSEPSEYSLSPVDKCPEVSPVRRVASNLKAFGATGLFSSCRYPRERLLNSLPLLLWEPGALRDPTKRNWLCSQLRTKGRSPLETWLPSKMTTRPKRPPIAPAYGRLWTQFN